MRKTVFILIISTVILGIAGFYYYQKNIYSKEILKLEIIGPDSTNLLDEVEYVVKYKNNGNTRLEDPELIFEYPKYAIPSEGTSVRIIKKSSDLGDAIYPGEEKTFTFKARLLGREGEVKTAKASLSYKPNNLKAHYESDTTLAIVIKKAPLTFQFDIPSKIETAQDLQVRLNYFSNIDYPLSNIKVMIEYPSDFEFISSYPESLEKTEWYVGLLNKAQGGRIEISGKLRGDVGNEKIFKAKIGVIKDDEFVLLKEINQGISIVEPDIHVSQQINNNPEYVASPGDQLHYEISFQNVGEGPLTDLFLICRLDGNIFDFNTIRSNTGDFKAGDNSIVFDWKRVPELQFLDGQKGGKVEFWVKLKDSWPSSEVDSNHVITNRVYLSQAREDFVTKVNSKMEIIQKGFYNDEIFGNSGPIPPKAGQETTYTVTWQAKNYYSEVKNAKVISLLPDGVRLTGKIFPEDQSEKLALDSQSKELVWTIGDLGISNGQANISFQIVLTPEYYQQGSVIELLGKAVISGQDQWTKELIESESKDLDTSLPDDKNLGAGNGIVE